MIANDKSFLGTGWGFPPTFRCSAGGVEMLSGDVDILGLDENQDSIVDIQGSLYVIISTRFGERVMQPTFGCDLHGHGFAVMNTPNIAMIEKVVHDALVLHEPRIIVEAVSSKFLVYEGILSISVAYRIVTTNTRYNYVYPFYIKEATNLEL
jgi:phage baseplate assembly protein W